MNNATAQEAEAVGQVFFGTITELRNRVRRVENEWRNGRHPFGVIVKCQHKGCERNVVLRDQADLDLFEHGEFYCDVCNERDFWNLPKEIREKRIALSNEILRIMRPAIMSDDKLAKDKMNALLGEYERLCHRFQKSVRASITPREPEPVAEPDCFADSYQNEIPF